MLGIRIFYVKFNNINLISFFCGFEIHCFLDLRFIAFLEDNLAQD